MRRLIPFPSSQLELWNESHEKKVKDFLEKREKSTLVVFYEDLDDKGGRLMVQNEIPTTPVELITYFTKSYYSQEINNKELFQKHVQYGTFSGKHLLSLLRMTSGLYAPLFFGNKAWPDSNKTIILFFSGIYLNLLSFLK